LWGTRLSELELCSDIAFKLCDGETDLLHGVAVTDGDTSVVFGFKVIGDAEGSANLILTAIALTDRAGIVEVYHEFLGKVVIDLLRLGCEFLGKGKDRRLIRCESGMEAKNDTDVILGGVYHFFVIRITKEGKEDTVSTKRGLDDIGNISFVGLGIEIVERVAAYVGVLCKVIVGSVGNAPKLAPAEREEEFKVSRCLGVEAKLVLIVVTKTEVFRLHAEIIKEVAAITSPEVEPFQVGTGLAEEFQFHLFEFADTENEVAGCDLVTEGFTDLCDAEGYLAARGSLNILEVYKNTLCGFGTEVDLACRVFGNADEGLEHQVELADGREVRASARGTFNVVFTDVIAHSVTRPTVGIDIKRVFGDIVFNELIGSVTAAADLTVHQRIGEAGKVAGGFPGFRIHQNCGVETDVIGRFLDEFLPPCLFDVVFHFHAERTVVPRVGKTAVDLTAGVYDAAVFTQGNDFIHSFFSILHTSKFLSHSVDFCQHL